MPDEIDVYTWLESPLYGALLQALDALGRAMGADAAVGRVLGVERSSADTCAIYRHLNLTHSQEALLADWPQEEGSLFQVLEQSKLEAGVFRPRDRMDEQAYASRRLFSAIDAHHPVSDCLCLAMELSSEISGVLCFLRCAPNLSFAENQVAVLRRMQPTIQRLIRGGVRREIQPTAAPSAGPTSNTVVVAVNAVPLPQRLARLSKTERQVLSYLQTAMTERQIADALYRSHHTVHVHVKSIYRKLSIGSRKQLMALFSED